LIYILAQGRGFSKTALYAVESRLKSIKYAVGYSITLYASSVFDSSDYFSFYKVHNSLLVMCTEELASIIELIWFYLVTVASSQLFGLDCFFAKIN